MISVQSEVKCKVHVTDSRYNNSSGDKMCKKIT